MTVFDDDGHDLRAAGAAVRVHLDARPAPTSGRATLLASAVDSDGRSTLGIVRVRVAGSRPT